MSKIIYFFKKEAGWKRQMCCLCVPDRDSAQDASDFNWDEYLEENGAVSVPHQAFKHVGADNLHS